ncbi:hypothetical protein ACU4GD_22805 [Cupriavidus basilensis]
MVPELEGRTDLLAGEARAAECRQATHLFPGKIRSNSTHRRSIEEWLAERGGRSAAAVPPVLAGQVQAAPQLAR